MKKHYYLLCALFLLVTQISLATEHNINSPEEIESLTLAPGDVVILKDGTYTSDERIKFIATGTAAAPITFRAATPGGVKFTGGLQMDIAGDYLIVQDFYWKGGFGASNFIQFRSGSVYANHSTIQNCVIDGLLVPQDEIDEGILDGAIVKHRWIVLYGTYNNVINCSFLRKNTAGALVLVELEYNAADRCAEVGHVISNNYFYKFDKMDPTLSNSGDSETIRVGTSEYQNVNSNTVVSNNYFVESDGENEIITNKSKGNTYTNNTFRRCRGSLVLRHGSNATVDGNFFLGENVDGTGGLRIADSNHVITNNYIQDCITVVDQAKWNNGITFLAGGDSADVICTSTSVTNGYQKVANITVSNNSIVNTNAPLFYNIQVGSTDPTGTVANNLIYFSPSSVNLSPVIVGETPTSFADMGTQLSYSGNEYAGTSLGVTTTGFAENTGVNAVPAGEIYTFTGANGKGANTGSSTPKNDAMVGNGGVGACFVDFAGNLISNPTCEEIIVTPDDKLTISTLPELETAASSNNVTVTANVGWTATSNNSWITVSPASGSNNGTVSVSVTENTSNDERVGTVTFAQVAGGDNIVRTLNVSQKGVPVSKGNLINTPENTNVVVFSVFHEEITTGTNPKNNIAPHSLDKLTTTNWSGNNAAVPNPGTNTGEIIYDLGGAYDLTLVDIMATTGKTYTYQIWVSSTTTDDNAFTNPFGGNLTVATTTYDYATGFSSFTLPATASGVKYVKIKGFGQAASTWNTIREIEFYGDVTLSTSSNDFDSNAITLYPVPTNNVLNIKTTGTTVDNVSIYSLDGKLVINKNVTNSNSEITLNTSNLANGTYLVTITNKNGSNKTKKIVVSHK